MKSLCLALCLIVASTAHHSRVYAEQRADPCVLSAQDLKANLALSFDEFDQKGTLPTSARTLGEQKCYGEAARATEHYLAFKPDLIGPEINVLTWHLGQYLASSGDERGAAKVMLAARRSSTAPPETDGFDWNTYVLGSWAFLIKDKETLWLAADRLSKSAGVRNRMNALVLRRLSNCFERSYVEAYDSPTCERAP